LVSLVRKMVAEYGAETVAQVAVLESNVLPVSCELCGKVC
jgi:hypothetical protein